MSFITTESMQIISFLSKNQAAAEAGGSMFGPVASRWPAWFQDALLVLTTVKNAEHSAVNSKD